jgi:hypothetical protein
MTNYNQYFAEQMKTWSNTRIGPPPIYNPPTKDNPSLVYNKHFNLIEAITELANENPAFALWIYENWALKQDVRYKHKEQKSSWREADYDSDEE